MSIYQTSCRLKNKDVNMYRKLRTSTLFEMLQETSIAHTEQLGAGREKTLDHGFLWVIMQQEVKIHSLPGYDDEITVSSWPGTTMHVLFPRYYQIHDSKGNLLVEGSALWALIDHQTRKMIFPNKNGISVPGEQHGNEYPLPQRINAEECGQQQDFRVPFSYCDLNGHMNNTRYFDLFDDLFAMQSRQPALIRAEYHHEARCCDRLQLHYNTENGSSYLEGSVDDQLCFRMKVNHESQD